MEVFLVPVFLSFFLSATCHCPKFKRSACRFYSLGASSNSYTMISRVDKLRRSHTHLNLPNLLSLLGLLCGKFLQITLFKRWPAAFKVTEEVNIFMGDLQSGCSADQPACGNINDAWCSYSLY
jgi:hypothetical protein